MERKTFTVIDNLMQSSAGNELAVSSWPTKQGDIVVAQEKKGTVQSFLIRGGKVSTVNPKQVELYYPEKIKNLR